MKDFAGKLAIGIFLLASSGSAASAAPFCVTVTGIPPECIYADAVQCGKRALQLSGVCTANPDELLLSAGTGRYCVVGQQRETQCNFADRNTCTQAASQLGGVCIENSRGGVQPGFGDNKLAVPANPDFNRQQIQPNPFAAQPNKAY